MDIEAFDLRGRKPTLYPLVLLQQGARLFVVPDSVCDGKDGHRLHPGLYAVAIGFLGLSGRQRMIGQLGRQRPLGGKPRQSPLVQDLPPCSLRIHLWDQPLPIAPQLERLQQVQRLPSSLHKQDVAQRGELRLWLLRRRSLRYCYGGSSSDVLTLLTLTPCALLPCDGLNELEGLCLAQRLQRHPADRQVASQVDQVG